MENNIKGAIFDLDGTIVDSMGMWRALDRDFVTAQGAVYTPEISNAIVGMTLKESAEYFSKALGLKKSAEEVLSDWEEYLFGRYINDIPLKRNSGKLIEEWHKEGVKMCVATLTYRSMAEAVLKKYGLLDKMEFILTVAEVGKSKLFPDIYLQSAERLGFKPSECVVLEDTCHAIETAKKAGFTVYAVDEDTAGGKERIRELCDRYITDFNELI